MPFPRGHVTLPFSLEEKGNRRGPEDQDDPRSVLSIIHSIMPDMDQDVHHV